MDNTQYCIKNTVIQANYQLNATYNREDISNLSNINALLQYIILLMLLEYTGMGHRILKNIFCTRMRSGFYMIECENSNKKLGFKINVVGERFKVLRVKRLRNICYNSHTNKTQFTALVFSYCTFPWH